MKILISAKMGPGTLEAKLEPLANLTTVSRILFVRKRKGSAIPKVDYIILPPIGSSRLFHWLVAPLVILRETRRNKPSLLISYHIIPYGFFVTAIGLLTRTPYIICQTGLWIQNQAKNKIMAVMLHWFFKRSFQVNCPGSSSVAFWQALFPDIRYKFRVLHSTIDTDRFVPDPAVSNIYDFIFLGRLAPVKNIDRIILGFDVLRKSAVDSRPPKLVIVGDGPEIQKLKEIVDHLGFNELVQFTGFITDPLLYLQQSRFLVMASSTEGLPTAMMQAMACGVIPISNLTGNIGDLLEDGITGFVHEGRDPQQIAEAMKRALSEEPAILEKMRQTGRERIQMKHSYQYAAGQWTEVLDSLQKKA